jgi:hypothetical protein
MTRPASSNLAQLRRRGCFMGNSTDPVAMVRVLRVAEEYPAVAPVVARLFQRICPSVELLDFNALRADGFRWGANLHWILFSGTETELLRLSLIEASMIPVRPKRLVHFPGGHVRRLARDRLSVYLCLDESFDRAHPLAALAPWNWPFVIDTERAARPSFLRLVVDNTKETAHGR